MESTPNKIAMEKKDSGAEFEQQDKIKIVRKKNSKNMKNSTKVCNSEVSNSLKTLDRKIR